MPLLTRASFCSLSLPVSLSCPHHLRLPQPVKLDRNGEPVQQPILNRGAGRRNKIRNHHRVSVFRHFVLETFGAELLRSGAGVLDIAGGKGELSFELSQLNGICSTVVDPRPLDLTVFERRMQSGRYFSSTYSRLMPQQRTAAAVLASKAQTATERENRSDPLQFSGSLAVGHLRVLFELPRPDSAAGDKTWPQALRSIASFDEALAWAQRLVWDAAGLHEGKSSSRSGSERTAEQEEEGVEVDEEMLALMQRLNEQQPSLATAEDEEAKQLRQQRVAEARRQQKLAQKKLRSDGDKQKTDKSHGDRQSNSDAGMQSDAPAADLGPEQQRTPVRLVDSYEEAQALLADCSFLAGMHPDQGAEPLVDFALAHNKPFAVVPCCVYSKEAPWRRLNRTPVRSYSQFIDYLAAKHPDIQRTTLNFEGKNQCLYWFGKPANGVDGDR